MSTEEATNRRSVESPNGGDRRFPDPPRQATVKSFLRSQTVQSLRGFALRAGVPGGRDLRQPGWRGAGGSELLPGLPLLRAGVPVWVPLSASRNKTVDKCTLCYHRITKGLTTACCEECPTGARKLVDFKNPKDPVHEIPA